MLQKVYALMKMLSWRKRWLFNFRWLKKHFTLMQITVAFVVIDTENYIAGRIFASSSFT
ncbi:MAG: hypothetical protein M0R48_07955 [Candidatus Omnitrophica bacterium]|nr:hypothetical protein [Candidatus Omnitrophota bacterium]